MNDIYLSREIYSETVSQKFTLYYTSSLTIFNDYMDARRSEWEEEKDFTTEQVRYMALKKYNNLINLGS